MEEFKSNLAFLITNSKGLFEKLQFEFLDFDNDHLNSRHAINAAITTWHLTDWTYQEFYKSDPRFQDKKKLKKGNEYLIKGLTIYQQYLSKECPSLELMKLLTNGSKHCILNDSNIRTKTSLIEGEFDPEDFYRHDYCVPHFVIKTQKEEVFFEEALLNTIGFWNNFLEKKYNENLYLEAFQQEYFQAFSSSSHYVKSKQE